jgi:hypothetical protein
MGSPIYFFTTRVGWLFGIFCGGRKTRWKTDELIASDLEKIRFSKRAGKIDDALQLANNALGRFPEHPEVMFLKAQILWEGFGYGNTARRYFKRVMEIVHEKESLHRWAASYIDDIEASPASKKEDQELYLY